MYFQLLTHNNLTHTYNSIATVWKRKRPVRSERVGIKDYCYLRNKGYQWEVKSLQIFRSTLPSLVL